MASASRSNASSAPAAAIPTHAGSSSRSLSSQRHCDPAIGSWQQPRRTTTADRSPSPVAVQRRPLRQQRERIHIHTPPELRRRRTESRSELVEPSLQPDRSIQWWTVGPHNCAAPLLTQPPTTVRATSTSPRCHAPPTSREPTPRRSSTPESAPSRQAPPTAHVPTALESTSWRTPPPGRRSLLPSSRTSDGPRELEVESGTHATTDGLGSDRPVRRGDQCRRRGTV